MFLWTFCFRYVCSFVLLCSLADLCFEEGFSKQDIVSELRSVWCWIQYISHATFLFICTFFLHCGVAAWCSDSSIIIPLFVCLVSDTRNSQFLIYATDSWLRLNLAFFHIELNPFLPCPPTVFLSTLHSNPLHSLCSSVWLSVSCVFKKHTTYSIIWVIQENTK